MTSGEPGNNAYTTLTASFVQPAVNANVTISVLDQDVSTGEWARVGQPIFIEGGGTYQVVSRTSTSMVITNLGYSENATVGDTIPNKSGVSPGGFKGATGAAGALPYKVYTALLRQEVTDNPTAYVLENTLGFTPVWVRNAAGDYSANNTEFLNSIYNKKVFVLFNPITYRLDYNIFRATADFDLQRIQIYTGNYDINTTTFTGADELLSDGDNFTNTAIEIRIYP